MKVGYIRLSRQDQNPALQHREDSMRRAARRRSRRDT
jgi:hypothetical protein